MFIDYVTLMLINAAAGFFLIAAYLYWGLDTPDQSQWAPAFVLPGLVSLGTGLHMIFTWPLPGPHNSAFGEMSVLFGALLTGAGLALWKGWSLVPLAVYGLFAGLFAIVTGIRYIDLGLSNTPILAGTAFILAGVGGLSALPLLCVRRNRSIRVTGGIVMALTAAMLAFIGYGGLWMHMESFSGWVPPGMR